MNLIFGHGAFAEGLDEYEMKLELGGDGITGGDKDDWENDGEVYSEVCMHARLQTSHQYLFCTRFFFPPSIFR